MTPAEMAWQEWWKERELGNKLCMGDAGIVRAAFLAGSAWQREQVWKEIEKFVEQEKQAYVGLTKNGQGEWPTPSYIREVEWAAYNAALSQCQTILREIDRRRAHVRCVEAAQEGSGG